MSQRTIGVEIECLVDGDCYGIPNDELNALDASVGADGSIEGDGEGIEVRTSPMAGKSAESMIQSVCSELSAVAAKVNQSCGLHVHVDARELGLSRNIRLVEGTPNPMLLPEEKIMYVHRSAYNFRTLGTGRFDDRVITDTASVIEKQDYVPFNGKYGDGLLMGTRKLESGSKNMLDNDYLAFAVNLDAVLRMRHRLFNAMRFFSQIDPVLRSLVPASRRHNTYCKPFEKVTGSGGREPDTLKELTDRTIERYCGINLLSLQQHGTIECRYHSGTINATKIIHWARLWERCVDMALSPRDANAEADALSEVLNGKNRLQMLCAMLNLPDDTTAYLMARYKAFLNSDSNHCAKYIKNKKEKVCVAS